MAGVGGQVHFECFDVLWLVFWDLEGISEVGGGPVVDGVGAGPGLNFLQDLLSERIHDWYLAGDGFAAEVVIRFYHHKITDMVAGEGLVKKSLLHIVSQFMDVKVYHINGVKSWLLLVLYVFVPDYHSQFSWFQLPNLSYIYLRIMFIQEVIFSFDYWLKCEWFYRFFWERGCINLSRFVAGVPPNIHRMPISFSDCHFWCPILIFSVGFQYILTFELAPFFLLCKLVFMVVGDCHFVGATQSMFNYGYEIGLIKEVDLALLVQFPEEIVVEIFRLFCF